VGVQEEVGVVLVLVLVVPAPVLEVVVE